jgi:hypothetical protein
MKVNTKKFFKNAILFLAIVSLPLVIQAIFPIDYFNYRSWEALKFDKLSEDKPFYTDMYLHKIEEGDLGYRTKYAIKKDVVWQTDEYGYRNNLIRDKYDIVIIGDSNIAGSGLSQDQILSSVLIQKTNLSVYSYSSAGVSSNINGFLSDKRFFENPPKIVIVGSIERRIADLPELEKKITIKNNFEIRSLTKIIEKMDSILKMSMFRYYYAIISEKISPRKIIVNEKTGMLFYNIGLENQKLNKINFNRSVDNIKSYKKVLEERGIQFIFLPIPDKENIYAYDLPERFKSFRNDSEFLMDFIKELKKNNITVIDTLNIFKNQKEKGLFQLDDTHWNQNGVNITADLIKEVIESSDFLKKEEFQDYNFLRNLYKGSEFIRNNVKFIE